MYGKSAPFLLLAFLLLSSPECRKSYWPLDNFSPAPPLDVTQHLLTLKAHQPSEGCQFFAQAAYFTVKISLSCVNSQEGINWNHIVTVLCWPFSCIPHTTLQFSLHLLLQERPNWWFCGSFTLWEKNSSLTAYCTHRSSEIFKKYLETKSSATFTKLQMKASSPAQPQCGMEAALLRTGSSSVQQRAHHCHISAPAGSPGGPRTAHAPNTVLTLCSLSECCPLLWNNSSA